MGLIVDLFCCAGGASCGIKMATGRNIDVALDFDKEAIEIYKINNPTTQCIVEDFFKIDPNTFAENQKIDILWASPECRHFSIGANNKKLESQSRDLGMATADFISIRKPTLVFIENVPRFTKWGPLLNNKEDKDKRGEYFNLFINKLKSVGYSIEYQILNCADYGIATRRKRFFLIARNDGKDIKWPDPQLKTTIGDYLDLSLPMQDIEKRKKPFAPATVFKIKKFAKQDGYFILPPHHGFSEHHPDMLDSQLRTVTKRSSFLLCKKEGEAILTRTLKFEELVRIHSYPIGYKWVGRYKKKENCLGSCVPPMMAKLLVSSNL